MYSKKYLEDHLHDFYKTIEIIDSTVSTNDDLKTQSSLLNDGHVLIANKQTGGKGRNGRAFHSQKDQGIYLSLYLKPSFSFQYALMLTGCVAIAIVEAIQRVYHIDASIKWVNDIYIQDKKVAGILCESALKQNSSHFDYLIVGIGINVHSYVLPENLKQIAGSIEDFTTQIHSREKLVVELLNRFYEYYSHIEDKTFLTPYKQYSNILNQMITVHEPHQQYTAKAIDIDDFGGLVIQTKDGIKTLTSGEISIRKREK